MSIIDDKLSEVFNSEKLKVSEPTEPFTNLEVINPREIANEKENTIATDFNTSRVNLHNLLIKGEEALIHKQQADVGRIQKTDTKTVNNNVFIGSTNELNKIIKNYKETEGE